MDARVVVVVTTTLLQKAFFIFGEGIVNELNRKFGNSWRVSQTETLFDYASGQSTDTLSDRNFPSRYTTISSLLPKQIQAAESICRQAGVNETLMEGCLFDVGMTGEAGFAQAATNALTNLVIDRVREQVVDEVKKIIPVPVPFRLPF
ncbi:MAG: hypothetical protein KME64_07145 [Scytonematopsis contorta HA4267-MV1]|nr:hypothetical protein [Scytonematopsis contorta HA4267-MV1]